MSSMSSYICTIKQFPRRHLTFPQSEPTAQRCPAAERREARPARPQLQGAWHDRSAKLSQKQGFNMF